MIVACGTEGVALALAAAMLPDDPMLRRANKNKRGTLPGTSGLPVLAPPGGSQPACGQAGIPRGLLQAEFAVRRLTPTLTGVAVLLI